MAKSRSWKSKSSETGRVTLAHLTEKPESHRHFGGVRRLAAAFAAENVARLAQVRFASPEPCDVPAGTTFPKHGPRATKFSRFSLTNFCCERKDPRNILAPYITQMKFPRIRDTIRFLNEFRF